MDAYLERPIETEEFPLRVSTGNTFGDFPKHWHSEIEILYIRDGAMPVDLGEGICELKKGDILMIGANKVHGYLEGSPNKNFDLVLFNYGMLEELTKDIKSYQWLFPILIKSHHIKPEDPSYQLLQEQILRLVEENIAQQEGYKYAMIARLYDFVTLLLRALPKEAYTIETLELLRKKSQMMIKIDAYIKGHYQDEIDLQQISKIAGYSSFHFIRVFKEFTGITFKKYLTYFRLEKARFLLLETEEPIVQVAYQSGFNSIKTFNRVFKEYSGCTPSDFKKAIFEK